MSEKDDAIARVKAKVMELAGDRDHLLEVRLPKYTRGPILDAGSGVSYRLRFEDGALEAVEWFHDCGGRPPLSEDGSSMPLQPLWRDGWRVEQVDPLTLAPSILCTICKLHGYIRGGKWVA